MTNANIKTLILGGGCFWCTEAIYKRLTGVISVTPGYAGGDVVNPTYEQICRGNTNHAEVVKLEYDETIIRLEDILFVFFETHDPTTLNKQGNDIGTQYRSIIFYTDDIQKEFIVNYIAQLTKDKKYATPIVTKVEPYTNFYPAESYHKNYYDLNPNNAYCEIVISPKIKRIEEIKNHLTTSHTN